MSTGVLYQIDNFNIYLDLIDLTRFHSVSSIHNLTITSGSAIITLPTQQTIRIINIKPVDLTPTHFLFYIPINTPTPQQPSDSIAKSSAAGFLNNSTVLIVILSVLLPLIFIYMFIWFFPNNSTNIKTYIFNNILHIFKNNNKVATEYHHSNNLDRTGGQWLFTQEFNSSGVELLIRVDSSSNSNSSRSSCCSEEDSKESFDSQEIGSIPSSN
jgi:hypothetical protein